MLCLFILFLQQLMPFHSGNKKYIKIVNDMNKQQK